MNHLIDANFDTRRGIYELPEWQVAMIETARACGASAKFAGSGGAIVGICPDEGALADLRTRMAEIGSKVIVPQIVGEGMVG